MNSPEPENEFSLNELDRDSIASRAYEKWESNGRPDGRSEEHWYEAERELRGNRPPGSGGRTDDSGARSAGSAGRHGPSPRSRGKSERSSRPHPPGLDEAASGGEDMPPSSPP